MDDRWTVVAALADASRRSLYDYVRRQDHPVAREEAADATGMSRKLAAFHLDKLVEAGLLTARYEAPPDRPRGRGRAPKVYVTVGDGLAVTVPPRRYELIAEILADAMAESPTHSLEAAHRLAAERGRATGEALRTTGLVDALTDLGFEPEQQHDAIRLRNCPFHALSAGWLDSHSGFPRYHDTRSAQGCYPGISAKPWATAHGAHSGTSTSPSRPTGSLRVITARWSHTPRSLG